MLPNTASSGSQRGGHLNHDTRTVPLITKGAMHPIKPVRSSTQYTAQTTSFRSPQRNEIVAKVFKSQYPINR